jgi:MFS transporter, MHS family, citrate/tricarballylate:H+ symporter
MSAVGLSIRNVAAAVIGNALEFYDFVVYTFFALQIGRVFFPTHSAYLSLMASLGTYGVGFAMRPIGGILIGRYADRVGRRPAMLFCLVLMGGAILLAALIPSYAAIGVMAPALFVLVRLAQGFALGGQVGSTTAFLMEAAPVQQRGYYAAWQVGSQYCAALTGGMIGFILSLIMSAHAFQDYGWRVAFALGGISLPFGLFLIRTLPETLHLVENAARPARRQSDRQLWLKHSRVILLGLIVLASSTIHTYVTNYMTTYAQTVLKFGSTSSFAATIIVGICGIIGGLFGGWLSDRLGRWPVMVWPRALYLILVWPLFAWMVATHSLFALYCSTAILVLLGGISFGPFPAALTESLPQVIRGSTFGTVYAVSIALFGGTAQPVNLWLLRVTGNPIAPAWYLIVAGLCGLVATVLISETAPVRLGLVAAPAE